LAAEKAKKEEESQVCEVTDEEAERIMNEEAAKKAGAPPVSSEAEKDTENKEEGEEEEEKDKSQKPNSGNGGSTDLYDWEQNLSEVTVNVKMPKGVTPKMLKVDLTTKKVSIAIKGGETILSGEFPKPIKADDSLWCIEDGNHGEKVIQLSLTKKETQCWWDCVIQGDTKINTQKVEPENSKLSDLDGDTRSVVEKMMFDQRQKQQGLPTSDEMEKQNKLKAFMDAHPEMDFSKAKFC